jgi:OFA family oxalate/formate antiporter-like MFS transporter
LGALSDRLGRRETLCLSYFLEAVGIVGLMHIKGAAMLSGAMFLLGFSYGGFVAILGPVIREFFGPAHMGKIMGFVFTSGALAGPLGPLLGGYLSDVGSYWWSFSLAAVLSGAAVLLCFLCRPPHYE